MRPWPEKSPAQKETRKAIQSRPRATTSSGSLAKEPLLCRRGFLSGSRQTGSRSCRALSAQKKSRLRPARLRSRQSESPDQDSFALARAAHDVNDEDAALMSSEQIIDKIADDRVRFVSQLRHHSTDQRTAAAMPLQI